jgi:hypothetical protein
VAATVASALGRPLPVRAEGETMLVGGEYLNATSITMLVNQSDNSDVFLAGSLGTGTGVQGESESGIGVRGFTTSGTGVRGQGSAAGTGVLGKSNSGFGVSGESASSNAVQGVSTSGTGVYGASGSGIGVLGYSTAATKPVTVGWSGAHGTGLLGFSSGNSATLPAAVAKTGVYGQATQDSDSRGVWGQSNAGQGVRGAATSGVGVFGAATTGFAFRGDGRLRFDKVSGMATIAAGGTSVTVTPGVDVTADSFVLLTPMANIGSRGLWFTKDATNDKFTIRISSSRSSSTTIGWLLLR